MHEKGAARKTLAVIPENNCMSFITRNKMCKLVGNPIGISTGRYFCLVLVEYCFHVLSCCVYDEAMLQSNQMSSRSDKESNSNNVVNILMRQQEEYC